MDEDSLHEDVLGALRRVGFDCLTATSAGRTEYSDADQLDFAVASDRVMFTHNVKDFVMLHDTWSRAGRTHCGIIAVNYRGLSPGFTQRAMLGVLTMWDQETIRGSLLFLRNFINIG